MGLGAGFKLKDLKDKERDKEYIKDAKDKSERPKPKQKQAFATLVSTSSLDIRKTSDGFL